MKQTTWRQGYWPLLFMMIVLLVVLVAHRGMVLDPRPAVLDYLPTRARAEAAVPGARTVVAYDPDNPEERACARVLIDVLNEMRIPWRDARLDRTFAQELASIDTLLLCTQNMDVISHSASQVFQWLERGGRLGLMMAPMADAHLDVLSGKLGIIERGTEFYRLSQLRHRTGFMPLWDGQAVYRGDGDIEDYAIPVRLSEDCVVHIDTGGDNPLALMWSRNLGEGRLLVNNNTLIMGKDGRGLATGALLVLEETVIYPIINAGMIFIDDFPAPQPEGSAPALREQFGYDIQGFFRNRWWPDMKRLVLEHGLRYTGVLVETYNDQVVGPFEPESGDDALIRYYATELLHAGGEMGLHGYNHMPLCPDGFQYAGENYRTWPSAEMMADSLRELDRYGSRFMNGFQMTTYVPPSNYLSDLGKRTLLQTLPQVRAISGLYLPEVGVDALEQEFREEEDGSVSVPRVTSGFVPDQYNRYVMAQELLLHGVVSHFIHPDDVLDSARGADHGWKLMHESFARMVEELADEFPQMRWSTASEGAAAIQRYGRMTLTREPSDEALVLTIDGFHDEAWLALKTERPVQSADNAECFEIKPGFYWLRADAPDITIHWGANA